MQFLVARNGRIFIRISLPICSHPPPSLPAWHLSFLEHGRHVGSGLLVRFLFKVGVDVGCGLVIAVADHLHGYERVDAALIEQGHVVLSEVVWSQRRLEVGRLDLVVVVDVLIR